MKLHLHQTHQQISDFKAIFKYLEECNKNNIFNNGIHVFPELFLTGYPLQDLCLQKSFINAYFNCFDKVNDFFSSMKKNDKSLILLGGLKYTLGNSEIPQKIENAIFQTSPGWPLKHIYSKMLLPNYDIFDEKKYFSPGTKSTIINFNEINIATLVCEDMWITSSYAKDPIENLLPDKDKIDLIVNLSASPYNLGKARKRIERAKEISHILNAPFAYVNKVGAEDEIIFDGHSFIVNGDTVLVEGKKFSEDLITHEIPKPSQSYNKINNQNIDNTWEGLFSPNLTFIKGKSTHPIVTPLHEEDSKTILDALSFGVQEYAKKCNFKNFLVACSGGMDSALVLAILKLALQKNQSIEAIYMPSQFSSDLSYNLSKELCKNLDVPLLNFPITDLHKLGQNFFKEHLHTPLTGLADENIQSRLRGTVLYGRSNQTGAMVINTSNKSELSVGYSTIYGDSVGALSLLGDIYKSEVYMLAQYINKKYNNLIPKEIIDRPPTAELRPDQKDSDNLPPYETLDAILEGILSYRLSKTELIDYGFKKSDVEKVLNLYSLSEYKRFQFCPILKIKAKSFGFGYRNPICKNRDFYTINLKENI